MAVVNTQPLSIPDASDPATPSNISPPSAESLTRRGFLRGTALAGGGFLVAGVAACAPGGAAPTWAYAPVDAAANGGASLRRALPRRARPRPARATITPRRRPRGVPRRRTTMPPPWRWSSASSTASTARSRAPAISPSRRGWTARVKVFDFTVDKINHRIDAVQPALDALGFNGTWPGPRIDVIEGDTVRAIFKNNLDESTGIHFHGQRLPNKMDGVPHITQDPIQPGDSFTYEFVARPAGSHMYHSHHNATDQVGRGLLGAFIVQPKDPALRYDQLYGVSQDIVWISNDTLGGFTINGRGFPATAPIVAKVGEKIVIRFMNEGIMTHPWHLHGMPMHVVARDGWPLGSAAFYCDTLGSTPVSAGTW